MDPEGQRASAASASAVMASLLSKKAKLQEELNNIEKQDPSQCGNVLKGFEGFLSSSKNTALLKRSRKFQPEDRLFSLSSVTSPALTFSLICIGVVRVQAEEQAIGREDGRSDFGPGRSKGGGIYGNGQGKPKKGRGASRDAKRYRHSSEDFDYDDDPDVTL
ncbi:Histone acetyltransferase subunit NuA4-domain-containing protein [Citrus sinensis]|uniref:Histone acetyltransferase subunit NuA4-domain-containing protein n=1 Tax=Citrus sinensis TaxID=2711 RepID=A0ACB8MHR0_CITSI|nr:Histone acetyltransferase subunit NuA4-domain-containing protein [Citrus sinensis]